MDSYNRCSAWYIKFSSKIMKLLIIFAFVFCIYSEYKGFKACIKADPIAIQGAMRCFWAVVVLFGILYYFSNIEECSKVLQFT